jgi:hypothetical protein
LLDPKPVASIVDVTMTDVKLETKPNVVTEEVMDAAAKEELEEGELRSDEVEQRPSKHDQEMAEPERPVSIQPVVTELTPEARLVLIAL